ncbi:MAG: hypothetical protein JSS93_05275 [Bacteroidetes bacterium]|nr:hypothetical protein [Bacteroidota bacterium]
MDVYFDDVTMTRIPSPVVQQEDFYPFGLAFNSYSRENSVKQDYLYNGKELQDELGLNWEDYGVRMYMPEIGRWGVIDMMAGAYSSVSPYQYVLNNPILCMDVDGKWTIAIHFAMTTNAFLENGYSQAFSDRLGHFASVYADNPSSVSGSPTPSHGQTPVMVYNYIAGQDMDLTFKQQLYLRYQYNVNYAGTANSQSETDPASQLIHSTRTAEQARNGRTRMEAVDQARTTAWNRIFSVAEKGLGENIGDEDFATLGLGVHALQDAERHQGVVYSSNRSENEHSISGDIHGNQTSSKMITSSVAKVYGIINNNFSSIGNKSRIAASGMSTMQLLKVIVKLKDNGYNASYSNGTIFAKKKKD